MGLKAFIIDSTLFVLSPPQTTAISNRYQSLGIVRLCPVPYNQPVQNASES